MRPVSVVIDAPSFEQSAGVRKRAEQSLIEQVVAQPADEGLGERILHRLARRDVLPGDLVVTVHHGREFRVMTNSPIYDQQLAINAYWDLIGGAKFLPGTINAADRFVRLSYFLKSARYAALQDQSVGT